MANVCKKCGQEEKQGLMEPQGTVCTGCSFWFHRKCLNNDRRLRKEAPVCDECLAKGIANDRDLADNEQRRLTFGPEVNSTMLPPPKNPVDPREQELQELRALLKEYKDREAAQKKVQQVVKSGIESIPESDENVVHSENQVGEIVPTALGVTPSTAVCVSAHNRATWSGVGTLPMSSGSGGRVPVSSPMQSYGVGSQTHTYNQPPVQPVFNSHGTGLGVGAPTVTMQQQQSQHQQTMQYNNNLSYSASLSFNSSQWRSHLPQEVLRRSAAPVPLTKDQIARRKSMCTVLPMFNGNPLKWLHFISCYLETTGDVCGFTAREEMDRLRPALYGHAANLTKNLMDNVDNLEGIYGLLQMTYGGTPMILAAMTAKVNALPQLDRNLGNIAVFAGQVDYVRSVNNLIDGQPLQLEMVRSIERKLPLTYAEKWLDYKIAVTWGPNTSTFNVDTVPSVDGNLNHMADFLLLMNKKMASLGVNLPSLHEFDDDNSRKQYPQVRKQVLMIQEIDSASPPSSNSVVNGKSHPAKVKATQEPKAVQQQQPEPLCQFKCGYPRHKWNLCPAFKKLSIKARWNVTKQQRKCYLCFGNHQQSKCGSTAVCNVDECTKRHHPLLHPVGMVVHEVLNYMAERHKNTLFRILPVSIMCKGEEKRVLVLMDTGSSVTLIDSKLAKDLGVDGKQEYMSLSWTDGEVQPALSTKRVSLNVLNPQSGSSFSLSARTYDGLKLPASRVSKRLLEEEGLGHLPIALLNDERPLILLGQDNTVRMRTIASHVGASERVVASETPLGFVVEGEWMPCETVCLVKNVSSDGKMERMLQEYIEGEHFGLQPDISVVVDSDENLRARRLMEEQTVKREDGRYETSLLWKQDDIMLPNNRDNALHRFRTFWKKLERDVVLKDKVMAIMASHLECGYMRKADSATGVVGRTWYLPVFNVHNSAKPDKVRLVYDAAAQYKGVSLNSALYKGPDLTVSLINVLIRFRTNPVAICGDLKDMYHRVYVREEDRCAQRILWWDGEEVADYEMCVLTFGATCSPSLAQFVKNLNAGRFTDDHPRAVAAIVNDHYIDDWLGGGRTEEEVVKLAQEVMAIHAEAGFEMHKIQSNSVAVLQQLGLQPESKEVCLTESAILGIAWNNQDDSLSLRFRPEKFPGLLDGSVRPTKRAMLRVVMSIYDPLGLLSFISIEAKIILREAWREQAADWDYGFSGVIQRRWNDWASHLGLVKEIVVSRWCGTGVEPVDLHVYVDASESAICAACYVVQRVGDKVVRALVMSKCLVAPLKTKSIPRLELDAALLGVRVAGIVTSAKAWTVNRIIYWTDAKDVIWWIRSHTRRYTPYVANRVANILSQSNVDQWKWTPTHMNPADWGTKWVDRSDEQELWWRGPDYLDRNEDEWPDFVQEPTQLLEIRPLMLVKADAVHRDLSALVPDVARFSRWMVFRNACVLAVKFVAILEKRTFPSPVAEPDVQDAEAVIFRLVQRELVSSKEQVKFLSALAPFYDQRGVLRMRGRAARSENLHLDARFPIIVIGDHPIVVLLILHYHRLNGHQNTSAVVNELRQKIVMPRMRATVRRIIGSCRLCAVKRAKPVIPQLGALPMCRMAVYMPSFSFVGIDYWGPLDVLVGRRHEKRWGALITCMTTRAVYLELVYSLSTESCIAALDSLVARRGLPLEIYSDNATCFVGAAKAFVGPLGHKPVWKFIPPRCPSMGGAWERLVGVTKRSLEGIEVSRTPTEEKMRHALVRVERLVNSRPLTDIPADPEEEECLTPNHFLFGSSNGIKPKAQLAEWNGRTSYAETNELLQSFWERFVKEYVPKISARTTRKEKTRNVAVGDYVHLCDDDYRVGWRLAKIVKVLVDKESDQVRQVVVSTSDGKEHRRAVTRIVPVLRALENGED